jgi:hypothetical protein
MMRSTAWRALLERLAGAHLADGLAMPGGAGPQRISKQQRVTVAVRGEKYFGVKQMAKKPTGRVPPMMPCRECGRGFQLPGGTAGATRICSDPCRRTRQLRARRRWVERTGYKAKYNAARRKQPDRPCLRCGRLCMRHFCSDDCRRKIEAQRAKARRAAQRAKDVGPTQNPGGSTP